MTDQHANDNAPRDGSPMTAKNEPPVAQVVIADDDPDTLEFLAEVLRGLAVGVHRAASGAELVVLLSDHGPFDLIVTDIDMPWMEGLAVVRSARAAEIETPVLFVSGIERADLAASVAGLGNARLLRKPFAVSAVRETVAEMLVEWEARRLRWRRALASRTGAPPPTAPEPS
jgi:CheY-like chemotaxis protein